MAVTQLKALEGNEQSSSKAVIKKEVGLNTLQAQKVLKRSFSRLGESMFSASVVLRGRCEREIVDEVIALIEEHFDAVDAEMKKTEEQTAALLEQHGISDSPDYSNRMVYEVEIKAPLAMRFIGLVERLDVLISRFDTLWLSSVLTDSQRSDWTFQWQQRLIKMASRVMGIEKSARQKADKQYREDLEQRRLREEEKAAKKANGAKKGADTATAEAPADAKDDGTKKAEAKTEEKGDAKDTEKPAAKAKKAAAKPKAETKAEEPAPASEETVAKAASA